MDKRKEDAHNPENLNVVKRNHTAAACIALLLTAGCGSRVSKAEKARSKQLVEATAKEKNYDRLMSGVCLIANIRLNLMRTL